MSELCELDFPAAAELARLQENALAGRSEAFVGTGAPDTILSCAHGWWRLCDVTAPPARTCSETTKAGNPCQGTPGDDGLCAAHKKAGDGAASGSVAAADDADQAPGGSEEGSQAEGQEKDGGPGQEGGEGPGQEGSGENPGA